MSDITSKSLTEIVDLIKKKEIKSVEVTSAYIDNIKKGKKLNSFITESFDKALAKSKNFDVKPNYETLLPGILHKRS